MKPVQYGIKVVFGDMECPTLPAGFTLVRKENACARAIDQSGIGHLIALNPNRLVPIVVNTGHTTRWDFSKAIPF